MGLLSVWCLLVAVVCVKMTEATSLPGGVGLPGGLSEEKLPNDQVQQIVNEVRQEVEEQLGRNLSKFELVSFRTQVVQGLNYHAKVDVGEEQVLQMVIYRDLQGNTSLTSVA